MNAPSGYTHIQGYAYTNASTLYGECILYTVNAPIIAGLVYTGLPQRIPLHLLYTVNVPLLYGECTYYNWMGYLAYTNASSLL